VTSAALVLTGFGVWAGLAGWWLGGDTWALISAGWALGWRRAGDGPVKALRVVFAWAFVALIMAVFVELGFRAFDAEWEQQLRRNAQLRAVPR
jgi:hypothetical protein